MNYRHAFHAGNFADVMKHAVLALVIEHLKLKPAPFRVIDTHAGIGRYDLAGAEAARTGEWERGIGRVLGASMPDAVTAALAPYLGVVRELNPDGALRLYPGSPLLSRRLMPREATLVANELHPEDRAALAAVLAGAPSTKVMGLDGWTAVRSLLPPKERRGLILIDPPFEEAGEFSRLVGALGHIRERFATGTALLWYPIKEARETRRFLDDVAALRIAKLSFAELHVRAPNNPNVLAGAGLVMLNPPYTLAGQLEALLRWLADRLAQGPGGGALVEGL